MFGTLDGEDANCSYVANELPVVVINVCYRHTPHHKFPTQREDCLDSFVWTIANASSFGGDPNRIVLGGISAGGGLCAWLTLTEHQRPPDDPLAGQSKRIKGQVLGIPWLLQPSTFPHHLIKSPEISSHVQCKEAPVLPMSKLAFFELSLADPNATDDFVDLGDAAIERLKGLPKTTILVAGMDVLRDEGMLYAENLKRAG
jgi:acetyl esterase/lipase